MYAIMIIYIYGYGSARRPATPPNAILPQPPQQPPHGGGLAIYHHPSTSHMLICSYAILTCWPRATYALHNRIPPCSVHYCLEYAYTIYLQYNVLLQIKYLYSAIHTR